MNEQDKPIWFPQWKRCLEASGFPRETIDSYVSVMRWYLSFCKRGRVRVTFQSARDFLEYAQKEKCPSPELLERWKEAIRWFFRGAAAEDRGRKTVDGGQRSAVRGHPPSSRRAGRDYGATGRSGVR